MRWPGIFRVIETKTVSERAQVVFVFDCGSADLAALRAIRPLADSGVPQVMGLFIEDEALYGAAAIPGVVEVSLASLRAERMDPARMRQDLERHAQEVRSRFEQTAQHLRLHHSFKSIRGEPAEMLSNIAGRSDFVVLCRPLRGAGFRSRRLVQLDHLMSRYRQLMFVNEPWETGSRVVVVAGSASPASDYAVDKGADIAAAEGLEFVIATAAGESGHLDRATIPGRSVALKEISEATIVALCQREDARLLVVDVDEKLDWQALLDRLLDRLSCSLLIVNPEAG